MKTVEPFLAFFSGRAFLHFPSAMAHVRQPAGSFTAKACQVLEETMKVKYDGICRGLRGWHRPPVPLSLNRYIEF